MGCESANDEITMVRGKVLTEIIVAQCKHSVVVSHSKGIDVVLYDVLNPKFLDKVALSRFFAVDERDDRREEERDDSHRS